MLSPTVLRELTRLLESDQQGDICEQECRGHLGRLVTEENAKEVLEAPAVEAIPWLEEAIKEAAVDAECLCPEESPFQERPIRAAYHLRVADVLLAPSAGRSRAYKTQVVCLPAFDVEWAVRVCGSAKIGFTAILTKPDKQIWCHPEPQAVQVRTTQRPLDTSLAESLFAIWRRVLFRTRHPSQSRGGRDGVSYHFVYSGAWSVDLAGWTWSPPSGTIPGKLVALSHVLRDFLEASEEVEEQLRGELNSWIAKLK